MGKLTINRPSSFIHKKQAYKVIVDGNQIGSIGNGGVAEFDLPAGTHTLQTGMGKWSGLSATKQFNIGDGETVAFTTGAHKASIILFILAILFGVGTGKNLAAGQSFAVLFNIIIIAIIYFALVKICITLKRDT